MSATRSPHRPPARTRTPGPYSSLHRIPAPRVCMSFSLAPRQPLTACARSTQNWVRESRGSFVALSDFLSDPLPSWVKAWVSGWLDSCHHTSLLGSRPLSWELATVPVSGPSLRSGTFLGRRLPFPVPTSDHGLRSRENENRNAVGQDASLLTSGLRGPRRLNPFPV